MCRIDEGDEDRVRGGDRWLDGQAEKRDGKQIGVHAILFYTLKTANECNHYNL